MNKMHSVLFAVASVASGWFSLTNFAFAQDAALPAGPAFPRIEAVYRLPTPETSPPTAAEVAAAVAKQVPLLSKYGPMRDGKGEYSGVEISAAGRRETGLLYINFAGVRASLRGQSVLVDYVRGRRKTNGQIVATATQIPISVSSVDGDPNRFAISAGTPEERAGYDMFVFKVPPLDSVEKIDADFASILARLIPAVQRSTKHTVEMDLEYPPQSIFANFERAFGPGNKVDQSGDSRGGIFELRREAVSSISIFMRVSPYRAGSKLVASFNILYELRADGSSSFDPNAPRDVEAAIRKAAMQ